VPVVGKINDVI
jgi:hypothetical protein